VYGGNVDITAISEIYKMSVNIYFVSERQITQPSTVAICQLVIERNVEPICVKFSTR
jgi:hypothetical protein